MLRRLFGPEALIVEYILSLMAITWGLWLCNPRIDFTRNAYEILAIIAPQWGWGLSVAGAGLLLLWSLARNNRCWRKRALFVLMILWAIIALSLGLKNLYTTALFTYIWIAALHSAVWLRLAGSER